MTTNRRILLAGRPDGLVTDDCLERHDEDLGELADGQARARVLMLSVDPTNRIWMSSVDPR